MKRRSLAGPLILILIGALFLGENLYPGWITFRWMATYWPFLLIAWGLLRLIEIVYWRLTSRPVPPKGVSGGEWVLVVLICMVGTAFFLVHRRLPDLPRIVIGDSGIEMFGETYDYPIQEAKSTAKAARIVIDNVRGNTRIVGADTQEIKVGGRRTIRAFSKSAADNANSGNTLTLTPEGDQLVIRTAPGAGIPGDMRISTDLEITVPRGISVQGSGRAGDFDILNIDGSVDINGTVGGVRLQGIAGNARVDVRRSDIVRAVNVKGNVDVLGSGKDVELENIGGTVNINGSYSGEFLCRNLAKPLLFQSGNTELKVESVPGQFNLTLADFTGKNLAGPIRLTTRTRDVSLQNFQGEVVIAVERGDINLSPDRPPTAQIDASTGNGNLEVTLPPDAKFEVTGTARRGEVTNAFGDSIRITKEGAGSAVTGGTGKGPKISLKTDRGEISLRKM